jgi:hypothetical protein
VPFTRDEMDQLLALATAGIHELVGLQKAALAQPLPRRTEGRHERAAASGAGLQQRQEAQGAGALFGACPSSW